MATTLTPSQPTIPAERTLRSLPIAANLLPEEIIESRRVRTYRRAVIAVLVVVVVVVGGWYGAASYQTAGQRSNLARVQDDVRRLQRERNSYADVISAQAESQAIKTQLSSLLAGDLQWATLLATLQQVAPEGVQLISVSGELTAPAAGNATGGPGDAQLPSTSSDKAVGTLTVAGSGTSKEAIAGYVDALMTAPGIGNPMLGDVILQDDVLRFTVRLEITSASLGGRFTSTGDDGSGEG